MNQIIYIYKYNKRLYKTNIHYKKFIINIILKN